MSKQVVTASQSKTPSEKKALPKSLSLRTGVKAGRDRDCWYKCVDWGGSPQECAEECK